MPAELEGLNFSSNRCVAEGKPYFQHHGQFSVPVSILLVMLMGFMVLITVLGNTLVIVAFTVDKSLRTQGNFFFLNLAIADLLVGGFCIPLYVPYILMGEWKFGKSLCKLWLVADYLVCTASVFNIVLISFDRFISVTKAVSYRAQKGMTRNAVVKMVVVWIAAFLLYGRNVPKPQMDLKKRRESRNPSKRKRTFSVKKKNPQKWKRTSIPLADGKPG
uniref:Muscarinic acetylcholine receptor n=1 Tax=Salvator merianae TaxID=96440 RepID=A0A8D0BM78_SALMN